MATATMKAIEIQFAVDVELTDEQGRWLSRWLDVVVGDNVPEGTTHWVSSFGDKPFWSDADAALFGHAGGRSGKATGEPELDDSVLFITTSVQPSE